MLFCWVCIFLVCVWGDERRPVSLSAAFDGNATVEDISVDEFLRHGHVGAHKRIVALRDLPAGRIGQIPREDCVTVEDVVMNDHVMPFLEREEVLTEVQTLMFGVLSGKLPFFDVITLNAPLVWPSEEVVALKGTQLWSTLRDALDALKKSHRTLVQRICKENYLEKEKFTFQRWKQAYAIIK